MNGKSITVMYFDFFGNYCYAFGVSFEEKCVTLTNKRIQQKALYTCSVNYCNFLVGVFMY